MAVSNQIAKFYTMESHFAKFIARQSYPLYDMLHFAQSMFREPSSLIYIYQ